MLKLNSSAIFLMIYLLSVQMANAQNKVVVIPMAGDDVAMAQQNFRYTESANAASVTEASMCSSDVYTTPNQATQVLLLANANARFAADAAFWFVTIQVNKDVGGWVGISGVNSYSVASMSSWSQISTTDILDLDPNSSYQFRVQLISPNTLFSGTYLEYCELVVSASYKLPLGKNILEVVP